MPHGGRDDVPIPWIMAAKLDPSKVSRPRAGRTWLVVLLLIALAAIAGIMLVSLRTAIKPDTRSQPTSPAQPQPNEPPPLPTQSTPMGGLQAGGTARIEPSLRSQVVEPMSPEKSKQFDDLMNAAIKLQRDGTWEQSAALLEQAIPQYADQQAIYTEYARVLSALQRHELAYAQYLKAITIGPVDFDLQLAAGVSASAAGKAREAIEHFGAAQLLNKSDTRPPLYLGQAQARLGETDEAKKNLLLAANLKPDLAMAWGSLADIALRENAPTIALQHIEKARQLEPETTVWRLIEGRALKRLGKAQEALDLVVGLSSEQKMQPGIIQLMGECYGLLQKPAEMAKECSALADAFTTQGDVAYEAARWWERAGDLERAKPYARRALYLNADGAKELAEKLGVR
jgi:tetratricopeptide (TPR) repeat protein